MIVADKRLRTFAIGAMLVCASCSKEMPTQPVDPFPNLGRELQLNSGLVASAQIERIPTQTPSNRVRLTICNTHEFGVGNVRCLIVFGHQIASCEYSGPVEIQTENGYDLSRHGYVLTKKKSAYLVIPELPPQVDIDILFGLKGYTDDSVVYCSCFTVVQ